MKYIFLVVFSFGMLMTSCVEKGEVNILHTPASTGALVEIPNTTVDKSVLCYNHKTSLWTWNDELYSGYMVHFYEDSTLKEKIGILNGKKENQARYWYRDGHDKQIANYHNGKLHGEKKVWSSDTEHVLISQLNYQAGKPHGEQKKWYLTGELHKKLTLNMGREEGLQQAFRENGGLYANYEAKNGRIFGLKKASLCYGLESEDIQYEK